MTEFDRTEDAYIESIIEDAVQMPQIGEVTEVTEHTQEDDPVAGTEDDFSNFEANVRLRDELQERRNIPIAQPGKGMLQVPREGDMVIVHFLDESGSGEFPIITQTLYNDVDRAPLGKAGIIRYIRGDLYFEMDPDGNWMRMSYKPDGDDAAPAGGFELSADGSFKIGDAGGYGIVSDGNGNFKWYEKSVDFIDDGRTMTW